jgi:hypothetical protein
LSLHSASVGICNGPQTCTRHLFIDPLKPVTSDAQSQKPNAQSHSSRLLCEARRGHRRARPLACCNRRNSLLVRKSLLACCLYVATGATACLLRNPMGASPDLLMILRRLHHRSRDGYTTKRFCVCGPTPRVQRPKPKAGPLLEGLKLAIGGSGPNHLHPTPYTLHPTPYTLHPEPETLGCWWFRLPCGICRGPEAPLYFRAPRSALFPGAALRSISGRRAPCRSHSRDT